MHAFISSYLFPKVNLFDPSKWDALKNKKLHHPGLEHCALAMGSLKNSPWYIAKILENHFNQSNGACPGTNPQLLTFLQETPFQDFLKFYESTLKPVPSTTHCLKMFSNKKEKMN